MNKTIGIAFYLMLVITPVLANAQVWQTGGCCTIGSNIIDIASHASVPTTPNSQAISATTLYWIAGQTNGGTNGYFTQVELRANATNTWKGYFELIDLANGHPVEYTWTSVSLSSGATAGMDNTLNNNHDCLFITDVNNGANSQNTCFTAHSYGTAFTNQYGALESYDFTGSHFHTMGNIQFTGFADYNTMGVKSTPTLSQYTSINSPPACITSSTGSGTVTISLAC